MSRTSLRSSAHALSQPSPSSSVITSPPAASEINAVPVQPRRGGRTSFNWDSRQTDCLLEQVRAVLPRGHHEWEKVVANYNALMSESADYNRLKDKFFKLVRTVKPTGKNTKPSHIQQAQEISAEIEARVHGGLGDGEDDDDAVDRAAQQLALSGDEGEEKEEAVMAPSPSSAASSSSPSSPSMRRSIQSFPSERTSSKCNRMCIRRSGCGCAKAQNSCVLIWRSLGLATTSH